MESEFSLFLEVGILDSSVKIAENKLLAKTKIFNPIYQNLDE